MCQRVSDIFRTNQENQGPWSRSKEIRFVLLSPAEKIIWNEEKDEIEIEKGQKSSLLLLKDYMIWENNWLYKQEKENLQLVMTSAQLLTKILWPMILWSRRILLPLKILLSI